MSSSTARISNRFASTVPTPRKTGRLRPGSVLVVTTTPFSVVSTTQPSSAVATPAGMTAPRATTAARAKTVREGFTGRCSLVRSLRRVLRDHVRRGVALDVERLGRLQDQLPLRRPDDPVCRGELDGERQGRLAGAHLREPRLHRGEPRLS